MREIPWSTPLSIRLQNGTERRFAGPYDALDFLENEWPTHGKHYERAMRDCRAAFTRTGFADIARESFISACIEASFGLSNTLASHKLYNQAWKKTG